MRQWNEYKETMYVEPEAYEHARSGAVIETLQALKHLPSIDEKNAKGHSLLMLAAYNNHFELARVLIKRGADVNSIDLAGNTILMGAAFKGYYYICEELIAGGADVFYKNPQGQSALDFAYMFGRSDVAELLSKQTSKKHEPIKGFFKSWLNFSSILMKAKN